MSNIDDFKKIPQMNNPLEPPESETSIDSTMTDVELLERFVDHNDRQAIAAIIARHGPVVMGACRRILKNEHDASDAFQVTFLVLLKKASSLGHYSTLAGWLYNVAHRVSMKSKSQSYRRQNREQSGNEMTPTAPSSTDDDTIQLIHEELCNLP